MKKLSFLMAILPLLFCACSSFNEENSAPTILATPDLQAGFADDTRTYVENNKYLRWHEDDRLTAFYGNTLNRQYKFNGKTGANSGTFSLVPSGELGTGNAFDRIYAVYPYNETATITEEGEISLTLPAVQSYAENSFGKGANTMVAVTENLEDTFLAFKNACGYLKFKLYGDNVTLASIEVKGNNNEKIAGAATATIAFGEAPVLTMADDATTTVTIDCGEGITLGSTAETATEFWVVLPETTFTKGLTIKATSTNGGVFEKSTANEVVITRNEILPMAAVAVEFPVPDTWKIYYTASAKVLKTSGGKTTFGVNIVSNEWNEATGEGVITFDGEVSKIVVDAFQNCSSLTSITIPDSVTSIGEYAFSNCSSLKSFYGKFASADNRCLVIDGVLTAFAPAGLTKYTIPNGINSIGRVAFQRCGSLTSVTIGNDVTSIGDYAFDYCTSLKSVIIGTNVSYIGGYAFNNCTSLTSVTIPDSVTSIGYYAFWYCTSLTSITIPDSVTSIGNAAFAGCTQLTSIHITDLSAWCKIDFGGNITTYDKRLYLNNVEITELTIPSDVVIINPYSFNHCVGLTKVTIHDGVTSIGDLAFNACKSLTTATIGKDVTYVGKSAFDYCTKLKEIYCKPTTPPAIYYNDYNGGVTGRSFPLDIDIYVPRNSYSAYTQYTSTTEYRIASVQNWYKYNSHIKSYDFE